MVSAKFCALDIGAAGKDCTRPADTKPGDRGDNDRSSPGSLATGARDGRDPARTETMSKNDSALAGVNFPARSLKDRLGAFLAVHLLASQPGSAGQIGVIMRGAGLRPW